MILLLWPASAATGPARFDMILMKDISFHSDAPVTSDLSFKLLENYNDVRIQYLFFMCLILIRVVQKLCHSLRGRLAEDYVIFKRCFCAKFSIFHWFYD